MSRVDTPASPHIATSPSLSPEDLARVEDALEDIHLRNRKIGTADSSVPPAVFGAGGPMSVTPLRHSPNHETLLIRSLG